MDSLRPHDEPLHVQQLWASKQSFEKYFQLKLNIYLEHSLQRRRQTLEDGLVTVDRAIPRCVTMRMEAPEDRIPTWQQR